jgi:hypothetical protein
MHHKPAPFWASLGWSLRLNLRVLVSWGPPTGLCVLWTLLLPCGGLLPCSIGAVAACDPTVHRRTINGS